jgi:hypothetical protein
VSDGPLIIDGIHQPGVSVGLLVVGSVQQETPEDGLSFLVIDCQSTHLQLTLRIYSASRLGHLQAHTVPLSWAIIKSVA